MSSVTDAASQGVSTEWQRSVGGAGLVLVLCGLLYLPPALATPFFTKGEPREALVVRRMVEHGDWILPKRAAPGGWTIASKPPFFHWMAALSATLTRRLDEWTMRAPSVALATVSVLGVWLAGRALLPGAAPLIAAVVLATTFEWARASSAARVDAALAGLTTIGLLIFWRGFLADRLSLAAALVAYGTLAAATLTKGPVGVLLPGLVLGVAFLAYGRLSSIRRFHPVLGALLVLGIVGAWYLGAWYVGGDAFFRKHVLKENLFRFLGATAMRSGHAHPFWYYVPALAAGLLPWTPLVVVAGVAALRSGPVRRDPRTGFLLVWFAVVFLFYSAASGKRSVYLLALYPPAALLVGWWIESRAQAGMRVPWLETRAARFGAIALCIVLALPLVLVLAEAFGLAPFDYVAPFLHGKDQTNLPIVRDLVVLHLRLVVLALVVFVGAIATLAWGLRRARWRTVAGATGALAFTLGLLVFGVFQPGLAHRRSLAPFMHEVSTRTGGAPLVFLAPSFDFGAAFYAHPAPGHAKIEATPLATGTWVLVWDLDLAALPPSSRGALEVLATSGGTDPKGERHMVLARIR